MTDGSSTRWRPTLIESALYAAVAIGVLVTALSGASVSYFDGHTHLFRTPVWLLIAITGVAAYLLRVRFRTRTAVDDRSDDFFDRE